MLWYVSLLSRLIVGLALLGGGVAKSLNFSWFVATLGKYELVSNTHVKKVAFVIAMLELAIGVGLVAGLKLDWAASAAGAMLTVFTVAICIALRRGKFNISCGCGSPRSKATLGWQAVFRNLGLIALSCVAAIPTTAALHLGFVLMFGSAIALLALAVWHRRTHIRSSPQPNLAR